MILFVVAAVWLAVGIAVVTYATGDSAFEVLVDLLRVVLWPAVILTVFITDRR